MMSVLLKNASLNLEKKAIDTEWSDGKSSAFHYLWLRDNCPTNFHPDTKERTFDLLSVSDEIHPSDISFDKKHLSINWSEGNHTSDFDLNWLYQHAYAGDLKKDTRTNYQSWSGDFAPNIPRVDYHQIMQHDSTLLAWMQSLDKHGLTIVENMPDSKESLTKTASRISFLRETNFGVTFNVESKPNPINLAYTALALPLHTDLSNQEVPPGYQFLHCLTNESDGGESIYVDSLRVLEDMREDQPEKFKLLADTAIPFRFHDESCDIRHHHSVINLDSFGNIVEIKYNAHLASIFDLPEEIMHDYYLAYRDLMRRFKGPDYKITLKLNAGEMAVFDNRRVMHGRNEYQPNTGYRHLHGCYVDRSDFQSRLRILEKTI